MNAQEVDFNVWPKGELNTAYAKYFIGNSYLAPLDAQNSGLVNVTFEPRCRNNWHIHHKSVQVLICVAGHGWYVEEGKDLTRAKEEIIEELIDSGEFKPEFVNRFDEICIFTPLTQENLVEIVKLNMNSINKNMDIITT